MSVVVNVFEVELEKDDDDPEGYNTSYKRLGPLIGATRLGMTVYGLPPGQSVCPYHYEYGREEWLLVLSGRPTLRTPAGEQEVAPGDVVCFPEGPAGAHKLTNRTDEDVRLAMLSTKSDPTVGVYPDSNKIAAWGMAGDEDAIIARRGENLDYWDGEV